MMAEKGMTNQSMEAFLAELAKKMGDAGYCNYAACKEYLEAALSEGRRQEREEIALDSLETKYSYTEILQMAAEAIKRIPGKGIVGGGEGANG